MPESYWTVFGLLPRFLIVLKDSQKVLEAMLAHDRSRDYSEKCYICDAPGFLFSFFYLLCIVFMRNPIKGNNET
jgi:hypothetical protein